MFPDGDKLGLKDEDYVASVATLKSIAESLDLECVLLRERTAEEGKVAEFLLRKRLNSEDFMEVRFVPLFFDIFSHLILELKQVIV